MAANSLLQVWLLMMLLCCGVVGKQMRTHSHQDGRMEAFRHLREDLYGSNSLGTAKKESSETSCIGYDSHYGGLGEEIDGLCWVYGVGKGAGEDDHHAVGLPHSNNSYSVKWNAGHIQANYSKPWISVFFSTPRRMASIDVTVHVVLRGAAAVTPTVLMILTAYSDGSKHSSVATKGIPMWKEGGNIVPTYLLDDTKLVQYIQLVFIGRTFEKLELNPLTLTIASPPKSIVEWDDPVNLPENWRSALDTRRNRTYWYNIKTNQTSWEPPASSFMPMKS